MLVGDAGVGKLRLAREALAVAQADGAHAIWIQASWSAAAVPLGALHDLVPDTARSDDVVALMRRCAESLEEAAGGRRDVLGVDDAQLLDPASATVVLRHPRWRRTASRRRADGRDRGAARRSPTGS